jgi:hypothetical protein
MITGLMSEEWYHWSIHSGELGDYSLQATRAYRAWLHARYRTTAALRRAWNDTHAEFDSIMDTASVFCLENNGSSPDSWKIDPIKWSDGSNARDPWIGEKWDHLIPLDVVGDGELDLLVNVEERYNDGLDGKDLSWFSVVWFENPLRHP